MNPQIFMKGGTMNGLWHILDNDNITSICGTVKMTIRKNVTDINPGTSRICRSCNMFQNSERRSRRIEHCSKT